MKTIYCKECNAPAYSTNGVQIFIGGEPLKLPGESHRIHFNCQTKDCKGWIHWEKRG